MTRSTHRILTTHVGSLTRPTDLREMLEAKDRDAECDEALLAARLRSAVTDVVREQAAAGIDIVSDGEFGKISFNTYLVSRLGGFQRGTRVPRRKRGRDEMQFPEFYRDYGEIERAQVECVGPITYRPTDLHRDLANLKDALSGVQVVQAFVPATAPSSNGWNRFYATEGDYLQALAEAMREEYRMIIDAGFLLQVDDPALVSLWNFFVPAISLEEYRKVAAQHVDLVNFALSDIPEDKVRYHVCWGSWHGPHVTDLPLRDMVDLLLRVRAGAYSIEAANPRHAHEYHVWEDVKLPDGKVLIPGVISHTTNHVEHPELVAERIVNYAKLVGRENVIAGADCGFAQRVSIQRAHPSIVWAKFRALVEGANIATKRLWG